jgi:hypothetical protein
MHALACQPNMLLMSGATSPMCRIIVPLWPVRKPTASVGMAICSTSSRPVGRFCGETWQLAFFCVYLHKVTETMDSSGAPIANLMRIRFCFTCLDFKTIAQVQRTMAPSTEGAYA